MAWFNGTGGKPEEEKTVTAGTSAVTVEPTTGKTMKKVTVNPTPTQAKTIAPSTSQQVVSPDSGNHLSTVTVKAIETEEKTVTAGTSATKTSRTDGKFITAVTINPTPSQSKTVTPSPTVQVVTPDSGKLLSSVTVNASKDYLPELYNSNKQRQIINGGSESVNYTACTIKCLKYYSGHYMGLANDSSGDLYKYIASNPGGAFSTVVKLATGRNLPASGICCDGTNVWMACNSGAYSNRIVLRQSLADFASSSTTYSYYTSTSASLNDALAYNNRIWLVGEEAGKAASVTTTADGGTTIAWWVHGSMQKPLIKCCMYGTYPVAISNDGYYTYKSSITETSVNGQFQIASGLTSYAVESMNGYLCVAGTKSDGTYIYYSNGTLGSLNWDYIKISSDVLKPIDMAYANGLYLLAYLNSSGNTEYWCSVDLTNARGISGIPFVSSSSTSYEAAAVCTDGVDDINVWGYGGTSKYTTRYWFNPM